MSVYILQTLIKHNLNDDISKNSDKSNEDFDLKNKVNCEVYFVLIDNQNKLIVLLKLKDNDKKKI